MTKSDKPIWLSKQVEFWNERATSSKGTGIVPFRTLEYDFVTSWVCGPRVLDAGCGLGQIMLHLRRKRPELLLFGFDLAEEMLKVACKSTANVSEMNILETGFGNRTFDTVVAVRTIKNLLDLPSQRASVKELARIASRRLIVIDSIQESGCKSIPQNLYLSRKWLIESFAEEGVNLVWEQYFRLSAVRFPTIASSNCPQIGSDEGFFVFDRSGINMREALRWRIAGVRRSVISLVKRN